MTSPPAIDYATAMADSLRTDLDLHMDDARHRTTRTTALFDALILWGEQVITDGTGTMHQAVGTCSQWWQDHRPVRKGVPLDSWFEMSFSIDLLLLAVDEEKCAKH